MQTLDVINEMLGTMGEAPINTLEDPHTFRGACLSTLTRVSRRIQAKGWWFNMETLTLPPSALDSTIYLPGDYISVRCPTRDVIQRGRRLYDLSVGSYAFTAAVDVTVIRLVNFQDLPETAAAHIAATAVVEFQSEYDGDTTKTRALKERITGPDGTFAAINIEHTRDRKANLIQSNVGLMRLKFLTQRTRQRFVR